jgi:hypothetical protein
LSIFILPWLTFAFCFNVPFFLGRFNWMATDIGSHTAGLDEHVLRLGIGLKKLRKTAIFFYVPQLFPL